MRRQQDTQSGKVRWLAKIGRNFFCRLVASLRVISERQMPNLKCLEFYPPQVGESPCAGKQGPKVGKVRWLARIGQNFFCRLAASQHVICERQIANLQSPDFHPPQVGERACAGRQGPKVGKVRYLARIGPNFFCRLVASLRVICEPSIANLKCLEYHPPQVGESACGGRQAPKVRKARWLARIGPNFFSSLAASLRVICERQTTNLKSPEYHSPQVGGSAGRRAPKLGKARLLARIGPNLFCRIPASLLVNCEH